MLTRQMEEAVTHVPALEEAGSAVARAVHEAVLDGGETTRNLADVLHGTWLGHPLHPVLTDITIGAWSMGAVLDFVGAVGNDEYARRGGDRLTALGTASAIPTALAGMTDYSTIQKDAASAGALHALLNTAGLGLYFLSLRERNRGRRSRGLLYSGVALGLTTASAWLGGHLSYRHRVGVDHSEPFDEPLEWTDLVEETAVPEGTPKCVEWEGRKVLLFRHAGEILAMGAVCSHAGGPLHEGDFDGPYVECPWHQSVFDLRDGSVRHGPSTHPQPSFDARVLEGRIQIRSRQRTG